MQLQIVLKGVGVFFDESEEAGRSFGGNLMPCPRETRHAGTFAALPLLHSARAAAQSKSAETISGHIRASGGFTATRVAVELINTQTGEHLFPHERAL